MFWLLAVRGLTCLVAGSSCSGDVFVVDYGETVYEWHGAETDFFERTKGLELALKLRSTRGEGCKVVPIEEGAETDDFWEAVGGKGDIKPVQDGPEEEEKAVWEGNKLMVMTPGGGEEKLEAGEGGFTRGMLDTGKVYAVDTRDSVLVWVGSGSSEEDKKGAAEWGCQLAKGAKATCRVVEGKETATVTDCFADWAKAEGTETGSVEGLLLVDGGQGETKVWRVFKSGQFTSLVPVAEASSSRFYSGECCVVEYKYTSEESGKEDAVVYLWIGTSPSM